jgi:hypothetical protein
MRTYTRIVFGLNAAYLMIVGVLCLLGPELAVGVYGGTEVDHASTLLLITVRLLGVNLIPAGVISVVVAADPDRHPILRALMGLLATLTLVCWGIVIGMHDLTVGQIASATLDVVVQVALLVAVVGYYPRSSVQQIIVRRRGIAV